MAASSDPDVRPDNADLDLALIGNSRIGALLDSPGADCAYYSPGLTRATASSMRLTDGADRSTEGSGRSISDRFLSTSGSVLQAVQVLTTRLHDNSGGIVELTDCVPRFQQHGRLFQPTTIVRSLRRIAGNPQVVVRVHPGDAYGRTRPQRTVGSHHIRYVGTDFTLRCHYDGSVTAILEERPFFVEELLTMLFGADEWVPDSVHVVGRRFIEETLVYWRGWVRQLAIPFEWQKEVIRAAIALQLNAFDDTGAIVAAMTTSIPESADSGRNWDYRYCWLRDSYFVVNVPQSTGRYLDDGRLPSLYCRHSRWRTRPALAARLPHRRQRGTGRTGRDALAGYRGMAPVRVGNDAFRQIQHDVYGSQFLAVTHVFFDERLTRLGDRALFERLEPLGRMAATMYNQPDAGMPELRGTSRIHTLPQVSCAGQHATACRALPRACNCRIERGHGGTRQTAFMTS